MPLDSAPSLTRAYSGIYEIKNDVNGNTYVGSAADFNKRWNHHRCLLQAGRHHNRHLQAAWARYGAEAFSFRRLIICAKPDLLLYEQAALNGLRPEYNIAPVAGNTLGVTLSPERRAKIAAKAIGRKRSPESIEKGAAARRGVPLSSAHRAHLIGNKHAAGHKHSDEWKAANSVRNTGVKRPKSPEQREKIAAALRGIPHSDERKAKQAAAQLGKKRGPYKKAVPNA